MIATTQRHDDAEALLRDLYQSGARDPHGIPHLIAGSQDPASLEPERNRDGSRNLPRLAGWLNQLPEAVAPGRQPGRVWHCTIRAQPGETALTDQQWAQAAAIIADRAGLAPAADYGAARWIAARHGRDHIHLIAALNRQDGTALSNRAGTAALAQNGCRYAREHLGLRLARLAGTPVYLPGAARLACLNFPAGMNAPQPPAADQRLARTRQEPGLRAPRRTR